MLFHFLLVVVSSFLVVAYPQNPDTISQVDGFVFDGPTGGGISSNGQQRTTTRTTAPTRGSTTTTTATPTTTVSDDQFNACLRICPVTEEYNPVCGSDSVDYTNPGGLGCAQRCGKDITLHYYGRCSTG